MVPLPVAIGLSVCDYVLIKEETRKVTLVGTFRSLTATRFPFLAPPFFVSALLSDGGGEGTASLVLTRLDTDEEIYRRRRQIRFQDRLQDVQIVFRLSDCQFPSPGVYQFTLQIDGEWVAQRRLRLISREE